MIATRYSDKIDRLEGGGAVFLVRVNDAPAFLVFETNMRSVLRGYAESGYRCFYALHVTVYQVLPGGEVTRKISDDIRRFTGPDEDRTFLDKVRRAVSKSSPWASRVVLAEHYDPRDLSQAVLLAAGEEAS